MMGVFAFVLFVGSGYWLLARFVDRVFARERAQEHGLANPRLRMPTAPRTRSATRNGRVR